MAIRMLRCWNKCINKYHTRMDVIQKLDSILSERNKIIRMLKGETPTKKQPKESNKEKKDGKYDLTPEQQQRLEKLLAIKDTDDEWNLSEEVSQKLAWIDKYEFEAQLNHDPVVSRPSSASVEIPKNVKNPFSFGKSLLDEIDQKLSKLDE